METIPFNECTQIGFLQKPHGVYGRISLLFQEEFDESVETARLFFINVDGGLVPFFVEGEDIVISSAKKAIVKFKWVDSEEEARGLTGYEVWLKNSDILHSLPQASVNELVGFELYSAQKERIGGILKVDDFSGNIVLTVDYSGNEIMVPFDESLMDKMDEENKMLYLKIPPGLLDPD